MPKKRERKPLKVQVKVDLSDWELGDWPSKIEDLIEVDKSSRGVEITLKLDDTYDAVAREIAQQALDAFFDSDVTFASVTSEGITIRDDNAVVLVAIPFDRIYVRDNLQVFDAIRVWMKELLAEYGTKDKEAQDRIIAEYKRQGLTPPTFNEDGEQVMPDNDDKEDAA